MPPEPPAPGAGGPAGDDFEALAQRAAAAAERGAARQRDLDADAPLTTGNTGRRLPSTVAIVALVVVVFVAGGAVGWLARGGSGGDDAAAPIATTPSLPTTGTAAVVPTTGTPSTIAPSTTGPAAPVTSTPPTDSSSPPGVTPPPDASPPATGAPQPQMQHTVRSGESFWAIAAAEVERVTQHQPDLTQVDGYWRALVRANADRLVHPGNPDLVYVGQVLDLPPVPASP